MNYSCPVVLVRASGAEEEGRAARMRTDLSPLAYFDGSVVPAPGDEIHCELFDEPHVVAGVIPFARRYSSMQCWQVHIVPRAKWIKDPVPPPTLEQALDDLQATVEQLLSNVSRHDAAIDIAQIRMELQRSRPEKSRVIGLVSRLSTVAGLEEKSASLLPLVERFSR